jgi:hypothetical protein
MKQKDLAVSSDHVDPLDTQLDLMRTITQLAVGMTILGASLTALSIYFGI